MQRVLKMPRESARRADIDQSNGSPADQREAQKWLPEHQRVAAAN
jgi:hypothetical protein